MQFDGNCSGGPSADATGLSAGTASASNLETRFTGRLTLFLLVVLVAPASVAATGKGQGAIVNRQNVPVYTSSTATEPVVLLNRGKAVSAISGNVLLAPNYRFDETEGRVRIQYFAEADDRGRFVLGWIDPRALAKFTYDCSCGPKDKCSPFDVRGLKFSFAWNACFQEARDAKLEQLEQSWQPAQPEGRGSPATGGARESSATAVAGGAAIGTREAAPSAVNTPCGNNFTSSGSMVRGATFRTSLDVQGVNRQSAMKRISAVVPAESLALIAQNETSGLLQTIGRTPNGRPYTVDFTITETASGITATVLMKTSLGIGTSDDAIRDQLCKILSSINDVASPHARPLGSPAAATIHPIEERLRKLDDLRKKGLITEDEYKKKKADLLKDL